MAATASASTSETRPARAKRSSTSRITPPRPRRRRPSRPLPDDTRRSNGSATGHLLLCRLYHRAGAAPANPGLLQRSGSERYKGGMVQPQRLEPRPAEEPGASSEAYRRYVLGLLLVVYVFNFLDRQILTILL